MFNFISYLIYKFYGERKMATKSIEEINITNWQATGSNVPFPQFSFHLEMKWTNEQGEPQVHSDTYTFPNILQTAPSPMPVSVLKIFVEQMIIALARVNVGQITWEEIENEI